MAPPPLIKGYLPVRLKLPSVIEEGETEETIFYVKEHRIPSHTSQSQATEDGPSNALKSKQHKTKSDTLFVVNAPVVPSVRTSILLKSILGRYGDVKRVTVVPRPKSGGHKAKEDPVVDHDLIVSWTDQCRPPSFLHQQRLACIEGKFAHVVFASHQEMKRTLQALSRVMAEEPVSETVDDLPGLSLDMLEIRTLADDDQVGQDDHDSDSDSVEDTRRKQQKRRRLDTSAVLRVADRYRQSCMALSTSTGRAKLMDECNRVMQDYEDAEERDRLAREAAANQPDDDGFVTVSYSSSQVGSKRDLEEIAGTKGKGVLAGRGRKGHKQRNRKKKQASGASELADFYRFQTKVHRKKSLQELRQRFEEDLARVQKMKEERQYRPF